MPLYQGLEPFVSRSAAMMTTRKAGSGRKSMFFDKRIAFV